MRWSYPTSRSGPGMVVDGMIEGFRPSPPTPLRPGKAKAALAINAADRVIVEIFRTNSLPSFLQRGRLPRLRGLGCGRLRGAADHLGTQATLGDHLHGLLDVGE